MNIPNFTNIIDFNNLTSVDRIFEVTPSAQGNYLYSLIFFCLAFILAIAIWKFMSRIHSDFRRIYASFATLFLTFAISGLVMVFMRWQQVPYLGSRFLFYILFLLTILWALNILSYRYFSLPKQIKKKQEKEKFTKYLPKNYSKSF